MHYEFALEQMAVIGIGEGDPETSDSGIDEIANFFLLEVNIPGKLKKTNPRLKGHWSPNIKAIILKTALFVPDIAR